MDPVDMSIPEVIDSLRKDMARIRRTARAHENLQCVLRERLTQLRDRYGITPYAHESAMTACPKVIEHLKIKAYDEEHPAP